MLRLLRGSVSSLVSDLNMARYSHILVVVMGWNTDQEGALKNFNSLVGHLAVEAAARAEAGDKAAAAFRPLLVGVTWPSQWAITEWSLVPDPVIRGLSFPFKRFDADEVGRFALRHVVTDAVLPARDAGRGSPPVVLLGHSFGARALITALAGHAFRPGEDERPQKANAAPFRADDRLILLEAAAEIRYLFDEQEGGGPLKLSPALADGHPRTTLTSSSRDTAVSAAVWGWYAGDADTFNELCRNNASTWGHKGFRSVLPVNRYELDLTEVQCAALWRNPGGYGNNVCPLDQDDPGREQPDPVVAARAFEPGKPSKHPLRYVDASSMINCPAPTSAGGAHGDIYRRETARFILDEIR